MLLGFHFGIHIDDWTKLLASSAHSDSACKMQIIGKTNININLSQSVPLIFLTVMILFICIFA